jgi:hypothetical protein
MTAKIDKGIHGDRVTVEHRNAIVEVELLTQSDDEILCIITAQLGTDDTALFITMPELLNAIRFLNRQER